jgi:hypothetical protein
MDTVKQEPHQSKRGYSASKARQLTTHLCELQNAQPTIQLDLSHLAGQLAVPRARTFANEGLGRRLSVIERAVLNVYRIFPPDRQKFLSKDECSDIAIQLHAFAINLYAVFDNIAWVCVLEAGQQLSPMKIGPFKSDSQPHLPSALTTYLAQPTVQTWFNDYGKLYRDSTAHRIAPYLPTRVFDAEEGDRWQQLHAESMQLLMSCTEAETSDARLDCLARHEQLEAEKLQLGRNSLLLALSLTGSDASPPVYLHPQLLSDWGLVHELIRTFTAAMRIRYGWAQPTLPSFTVVS